MKRRQVAGAAKSRTTSRLINPSHAHYGKEKADTMSMFETEDDIARTDTQQVASHLTAAPFAAPGGPSSAFGDRSQSSEQEDSQEEFEAEEVLWYTPNETHAADDSSFVSDEQQRTHLGQPERMPPAYPGWVHDAIYPHDSDGARGTFDLDSLTDILGNSLLTLGSGPCPGRSARDHPDYIAFVEIGRGFPTIRIDAKYAEDLRSVCHVFGVRSSCACS